MLCIINSNLLLASSRTGWDVLGGMGCLVSWLFTGVVLFLVNWVGWVELWGCCWVVSWMGAWVRLFGWMSGWGWVAWDGVLVGLGKAELALL